jgi:quinol monooxygenase YgiN
MPLRSLMLAPLAALALTACTAAANQDQPVMRYQALPDGAFAVIAEIRAKPGMEDALREATLPLVAKVRAEHNNLLYFLQEDRAAPGHFIFYEIFATRADFEAHNATPHVQAWFARLPELAEGDVTATHMHILNNAATP